MIKVDIQVEHHKAPNEDWILILLGILLTLRPVKLTFAHHYSVRLQKHKLHCRGPNSHKRHGGQNHKIDPFPERTYPTRSFQYNELFAPIPFFVRSAGIF